MSSGSCVNSTPVIDGIGWYFLSPSVTGETGTELVNRLNANKIYSGSIIDICSNVYYHNIRDSSANGFPNDSTWSQSDWCIANIDDVLIPEIGYWIYILSYDLSGYQYVTVKWWSYFQSQTGLDPNAEVTAHLIYDSVATNNHLFENNITPDTSIYISKESSPFKAVDARPGVGYHKVGSQTITFELLDISTNLNINGIILKANSTLDTGFSVGNGTTDYSNYPTAWTAPWFAVEIVSVTDAQGNVTNQTRQNYYNNLLFTGGTILNYNVDNTSTARTLDISTHLQGHILSMYYHADQIKISTTTTYSGFGTFLSTKGDSNAGLLDAIGGSALINKVNDPQSGIYWWYTRIYDGSQTGYLRIGRSKSSTTGGYGDYSVFSLS